jgi:hypothetical protein
LKAGTGCVLTFDSVVFGVPFVQLSQQLNNQYEMSKTNSLKASGASLSSIDYAYGSTADLYKDVLGISPNATPEQIQRAYFKRRDELFTLKPDHHAQRKMDAVQMTARILADPELRRQYDQARHMRTTRVVSPEQPMYHYEGDDEDTKMMDRTIASLDYTFEQTLDDEVGTVVSGSSTYSEGGMTVYTHAQGVVAKVRDEVLGVMEDTATSFSQVLNVFTLQEKDILAVTARIDKARRQMERAL